MVYSSSRPSSPNDVSQVSSVQVAGARASDTEKKNRSSPSSSRGRRPVSPASLLDEEMSACDGCSTVNATDYAYDGLDSMPSIDTETYSQVYDASSKNNINNNNKKKKTQEVTLASEESQEVTLDEDDDEDYDSSSSDESTVPTIPTTLHATTANAQLLGYKPKNSKANNKKNARKKAAAKATAGAAGATGTGEAKEGRAASPTSHNSNSNNFPRTSSKVNVDEANKTFYQKMTSLLQINPDHDITTPPPDPQVIPQISTMETYNTVDPIDLNHLRSVLENEDESEIEKLYDALLNEIHEADTIEFEEGFTRDRKEKVECLLDCYASIAGNSTLPSTMGGDLSMYDYDYDDDDDSEELDIPWSNEDDNENSNRCSDDMVALLERELRQYEEVIIDEEEASAARVADSTLPYKVIAETGAPKNSMSKNKRPGGGGGGLFMKLLFKKKSTTKRMMSPTAKDLVVAAATINNVVEAQLFPVKPTATTTSEDDINYKPSVTVHDNKPRSSGSDDKSITAKSTSSSSVKSTPLATNDSRDVEVIVGDKLPMTSPTTKSGKTSSGKGFEVVHDEKAGKDKIRSKPRKTKKTRSNKKNKSGNSSQNGSTNGDDDVDTFWDDSKKTLKITNRTLSSKVLLGEGELVPKEYVRAMRRQERERKIKNEKLFLEEEEKKKEKKVRRSKKAADAGGVGGARGRSRGAQQRRDRNHAKKKVNADEEEELGGGLWEDDDRSKGGSSKGSKGSKVLSEDGEVITKEAIKATKRPKKKLFDESKKNKEDEDGKKKIRRRSKSRIRRNKRTSSKQANSKSSSSVSSKNKSLDVEVKFLGRRGSSFKSPSRKDKNSNNSSIKAVLDSKLLMNEDSKSNVGVEVVEQAATMSPATQDQKMKQHKTTVLKRAIKLHKLRSSAGRLRSPIRARGMSRGRTSLPAVLEIPENGVAANGQPAASAVKELDEALGLVDDDSKNKKSNRLGTARSYQDLEEVESSDYYYTDEEDNSLEEREMTTTDEHSSTSKQDAGGGVGGMFWNMINAAAGLSDDDDDDDDDNDDDDEDYVTEEESVEDEKDNDWLSNVVTKYLANNNLATTVTSDEDGTDTDTDMKPTSKNHPPRSRTKKSKRHHHHGRGTTRSTHKFKMHQQADGSMVPVPIAE